MAATKAIYLYISGGFFLISFSDMNLCTNNFFFEIGIRVKSEDMEKSEKGRGKVDSMGFTGQIKKLRVNGNVS